MPGSVKKGQGAAGGNACRREVTLLIISIPLMVLGFAIAIVPLVAVVRRQHRFEDEHIWGREARQGHVTDPHAHFASIGECLPDDEAEFVSAA